MKTPGIGRNNPCPCGSGKKFKRCCLDKEAVTQSRQGAAGASEALRKAYVEQFNWAYRDGHAELRFIQQAFLFTLYLLIRYGDTCRAQAFYEDAFLRAFPIALNDVPPSPVFTAEEELRRCYTWRTLVGFVSFLGLAEVGKVTDDILCHKYRVKALPLLREAVRFQISR